MEGEKNRVVRYKGGEWQLSLEDIPVPSKGQALIKVSYSTVNPNDIIIYHLLKSEGDTLGGDGCGVIINVGEDIN